MVMLAVRAEAARVVVEVFFVTETFSSVFPLPDVGETVTHESEAEAPKLTLVFTTTV